MDRLSQRWEAMMSQRQKSNSLRRLQVRDTSLVDFSSNDYLGLSRSKHLSQKIQQSFDTLKHTGNIIGATGSRLISGTDALTLDTEQFLSSHFGREASLIFNSGYVANSSLLATLAQKGDIILMDQDSHASLKEGARLSFAKKATFAHNDLSDLSQKLQRLQQELKGELFVIIESVYSMRGDVAPISEILQLCQKYGAHLIVDEAHSTGWYGKGGKGLVYDLGLQEEVLATVYTFGKAIGVHGACVVGSQLMIDILTNFARGFVYTTALPPHAILSIYEALQWVTQHPDLADILHHKIDLYQKLSEQHTCTPIQVIKVGDIVRAKEMARLLHQGGFDVRAILSPTVPRGHEILRVCLHTYNTEQEIKDMVVLINSSL